MNNTIIIIDGIEYKPVIKKENFIINREYCFELYVEQIGAMNWQDSIKECQLLGNGWRLPNRYEMSLIFEIKDDIIGSIGNFYWTSTEYNLVDAYYQDFVNGSQGLMNKFNAAHIHPIKNKY